MKKVTKKPTKKVSPKKPVKKSAMNPIAVKPVKLSDKESGDRNRDRNAARWRVKTEASNDIGEIPEIKNPDRRNETKNNFIDFCRNYGGEESFYRDWCPAHYEIAESLQDIILNGGKQAFAAPRGFCKSTFLRWLILFAILQHPEKYKCIVYVGAVGGATERSHQFILGQLRFNQNLVDDFPEVGYPFSCYGKSTVRDLKYKGVSINASFNDSKIVLPTVVGYETSSSAILFNSIGSEGIRGTDHTVITKAYRPSLVVIDDPQSDMSAHSPLMIKGMYNIITGTIRDLAGYSRKTKRHEKISVAAMCTCIAPEDLAMQLLDRQKSPDYRGVIYKRLDHMPENMELWRKYKEIRIQSYIETGTKIKATEFYKANREKMDAGCSAIDPEDYEDDMLSGIQFAMDRWSENEYTFHTEQMNDPIAALESGGGYLTPSRVIEKRIPQYRYYIPDDTAIVTAHIDVGKYLLWYCVTAWGNQKKFGHVVDYGVFPQQRSSFIRKEKYEISLQDFYTEGDEYNKVKHAIQDLAEMIFEQEYIYNNQICDINRLTNLTHFVNKKPLSMLAFCGVDAGDGNYEKTVWDAVRTSNYHNRMMPLYGAAAKAQLYRYLPLHIGEKRRDGCDWIANPESRKRNFGGGVQITSLKYDANIYKTEVNSSLLLQNTKEGTITIFDDDVESHKMFSEQLCSEEYGAYRIGANQYDKWTMKVPNVSDNDLFDALVATAALASFANVESAQVKAPPRTRMTGTVLKPSEIQRNKYYD